MTALSTRAAIIATLLAAGLAADGRGQALAQAPIAISPPQQNSEPEPAARAKTVRPKAVTTQPIKAAPKKPDPISAETAPAKRPAATPGPPVDLAYGAYQRGHFLTAFAEATKRANANDPKAMALLGDLYANGYGVARDDKKALEWYQLATARGDPAGTFALAMFRLSGRGGQRDPETATKLLADASRLGHPAATYDLGLLYLQGEQFPQDFVRAAALFRAAANAGSAEAQYALATLYKEGRGVAKDPVEAAKLMAAAAAADYTDAQVEYAIALFNGNGVAKDEAASAILMRKAALKGSPIAQNRLARLLATGRGLAANPVEAAKWHLIARAGGITDLWLDGFLQQIKPTEREAGEKAAKPWLAMITQSRS